MDGNARATFCKKNKALMRHEGVKFPIMYGVV